MPNPDAMIAAGEHARPLAGLNGQAAPQGKTSADEILSSIVQQDLATSTVPERTAPRGAQGAGELELKLVVDPDRMADFDSAPIVVANARNKGTRRHLKAVYYDTPDWTLRKNGLSLRVRQSGARFVQTVKSEAGDDPLRRGEWEASVPSIAPDLSLAMPFIPPKIRADVERHGLHAVFTSDIRRHQRRIDLPTGSVEMAFDHGRLVAGERSVGVCEIELELKSGSASAVYELAQRLAEHGPVRPSIRSKSARGFDLAADKPPAARKPRKLRLEPSISLDDAFATILRACLSHLLQSLPAAEDGRDAEGIHQLRVSLRRLRSALHLMRSAGSRGRLEFLRSEASWLAENLAPAREWDILGDETLPAVAKGCPSVTGFDALRDLADRQRASAYDEARRVLADRRCANLVIGLGSFIEARGWRSDVTAEGLAGLAEPAVDFAQRILSDQHGRVLKRGRKLKARSVDDRHRLRLAVKKLRYLADFLLPLIGQGKPARRFYDRLAALQEELGCYNDMATTASLLASTGARSVDHGTAAAAIAGWQAHAMVGAEPRLRRAWREFTNTATPWTQ